MSLGRTYQHAATAYTLAHELERFETATPDWARLANLAFAYLAWAPVSERPHWWTDDALLAMSEHVIRALPLDAGAWAMRGQVLGARTFVGVGRGTPPRSRSESSAPTGDTVAWSCAVGNLCSVEPARGPLSHRWLVGSRSIEQLREAAAAFGKAAELTLTLGWASRRTGLPCPVSCSRGQP